MTEIELLSKLNALRMIQGEGHDPLLIATVIIQQELKNLTKAVEDLGEIQIRRARGEIT